MLLIRFWTVVTTCVLAIAMLCLPLSFAAISMVDRATLKADFRLQAARVNRGLIAGPAARTTLREAAEALEAQQAMDVSDDMAEFAPTSSPLLLGRWYLDFTDASDVLSLSLLPVPAEIGDIYQEIKQKQSSGDEFTVDNAVELLPLGSGALTAVTGMKVAGIYCVEGACKTLSPTRVSLAFVGGRVQPLAAPFGFPPLGVSLPDPIISQLQSLLANRVYLETTYLDDDFRIARGPGRELYVLSKRDERSTADAAAPF